jgi:hypothetical protein
MTEMIFELLQKPFVQMATFVLLTIPAVFIIGPKNADHVWTIAGFIYIGFIFVNSILICTVSNSWNYFFFSLGFSVLYLVSVSIIITTLIKLLKIEGSGESAMTFLFIIYHPVFLLFVLFLKWAYYKLF